MTTYLSSVNSISGAHLWPGHGSFSAMADRIDPKKVATRLRAVMADLELETVNDLAGYLGAERSQVSNWLQGYNLPPAHWMDILCEKRPGITLDWLYRGVADAIPMALAIKLEALAQGMAVPLDRPEPARRKVALVGLPAGERSAAPSPKRSKTAT